MILQNSPSKRAQTTPPIQDPLATRWSPYVYADRPVEIDDLRAVFQAARWAASSFNEQPWRYVVARKEEPEAFEKLLSLLGAPNQVWARHAPVLALGLAKKTFSRNGKPNRVHLHDLGAASTSLSIEASARGLAVHQMAGVDTERAHEAVGAPEDFAVVTALTIGYPGGEGDPGLLERDAKPRTRKPLEEIVFGAEFGQSASWLG